MTKRTLFVTGHLAEPRLRAILSAITLDFEYEIWNAGVKVAALITEEILRSRLPSLETVKRIILPGRCRANLEQLTKEFGTEFLHGPDEVKDLPGFFSKNNATESIIKTSLTIFCEITDAPLISTDEILRKARQFRTAGADVVDLGCLPDTPFPHLENAIHCLRSNGIPVSVDSADIHELTRADASGADYLLSLTEFTIDIAKNSRPVLVPAEHGNLESLIRAYSRAMSLGLKPILDPILDPIHFGVAESVVRYVKLRSLLPDAEILMGTGNVVELTEVDSAGITALLVGLCSELRINNVLTVNVSAHTRRTLQEHHAARQLMLAARHDLSLPKGYTRSLLQIHENAPFPNTPIEISQTAAKIKDRNFRIEVSDDGIHIYNNAGHWVSSDAFELYRHLDLQEDGSHAFYLGAELQKAEIAFQLGKRYVQDEPLNWGVAVDNKATDRTRLAEGGHTLKLRTAKRQ